MPTQLAEMLKEEHEAIRRAPLATNGPGLDDVHRARSKAEYSGLCLSGGGIRSATFNLGVMQALAQAQLLDQFDYLSTVSGGGFIGSWFSAWKYRDRIKSADLREPISELERQRPLSSSEPEPQSIQHLRSYSNYLSPRIGLLSADFWTLAAIYSRNLLLNSMVFVPFILAALMLPRLVYSWMNMPITVLPAANVSLLLLFAVGLLLGFRAVLFVGQNLPISGKSPGNENSYIRSCLVPLVISAFSLASVWGWYIRDDWHNAGNLLLFEFIQTHTFAAFAAVSFALLVAPLLATFGFKSVKVVFLVMGAALLTAFVVSTVARVQLVGDTRLYVTGAFPMLFGMIMLGGTFAAGVTSRFTTDQDEEWWARSGGWMMIVVASWIAACALVLWVPQFILSFVREVSNSPAAAMKGQTNIIKTFLAVGGVLSTIVSVISAFSSATPSGAEKTGDKQSGWMASATSALSTVALVFIFAVLAALTNPLLVLLSRYVSLTGPIPVSWSNHAGVLANSSLLQLALCTLGFAALGTVAGRCIDMNKFSLHYAWRNRIVRAYAGASRDRAKADPQTEVAFTQFDAADNVKMSELGGQRPFHIINVALNLVGSKKLKWQQRLAESFTISGLHCGTHWLGYRSSAEYAGGISLGTAVAISGAAASPNMGYLMTSPVVRFLMALFNVRLGTWLGNPGKPGDNTYKDHAPKNIIRPIVAEALGQTDDESPYVYLSDGGHFENLGLYEMVLRRVKFIIVTDASTDPTYKYESLAQAIRKIRIDFGIPVEFTAFPNIGRLADGSGAHCAVATIRYGHVDKDCADGFLIYVKPSLNQDEPRDVINYMSESPDFPQESIADQFFSESQFESYRVLGHVIINRIIKGTSRPSISAVFEKMTSGPTPVAPTLRQQSGNAG